MPKTSNNEKQKRLDAIQEATKYAIEVPFKVMKIAYESMDILKAMAKIGLPASISDAGVGALAMRAAVSGAFLNIKINTGGLDDKKIVTDIMQQAKIIEENAMKLEKEILDIVNDKI